MSDEEKKAIEYLKENIKIDKENIEVCEVNDFHEEAKYVSERVKNHEVILNLIEKQDKEIETYKKIAEKLADELDEITDEIAGQKGIEDFKFCDERCINENGYIECKQCIINWAKNEVK